jgi:hypothetical protein
MISPSGLKKPATSRYIFCHTYRCSEERTSPQLGAFKDLYLEVPVGVSNVERITGR